MSPPGPRSVPVPRMGDVAQLAARTDRLDGISNKLDWLIKSYADLDRRLAAVEAKGSKAKK
jgi:hypothetical protein